MTRKTYWACLLCSAIGTGIAQMFPPISSPAEMFYSFCIAAVVIVGWEVHFPGRKRDRVPGQK